MSFLLDKLPETGAKAAFADFIASVAMVGSTGRPGDEDVNPRPELLFAAAFVARHLAHAAGMETLYLEDCDSFRAPKHLWRQWAIFMRNVEVHDDEVLTSVLANEFTHAPGRPALTFLGRQVQEVVAKDGTTYHVLPMAYKHEIATLTDVILFLFACANHEDPEATAEELDAMDDYCDMLLEWVDSLFPPDDAEHSYGHTDASQELGVMPRLPPCSMVGVSLALYLNPRRGYGESFPSLCTYLGLGKRSHARALLQTMYPPAEMPPPAPVRWASAAPGFAASKSAAPALVDQGAAPIIAAKSAAPALVGQGAAPAAAEGKKEEAAESADVLARRAALRGAVSGVSPKQSRLEASLQQLHDLCKAGPLLTGAGAEGAVPSFEPIVVPNLAGMNGLEAGASGSGSAAINTAGGGGAAATAAIEKDEGLLSPSALRAENPVGPFPQPGESPWVYRDRVKAFNEKVTAWSAGNTAGATGSASGGASGSILASEPKFKLQDLKDGGGAKALSLAEELARAAAEEKAAAAAGPVVAVTRAASAAATSAPSSVSMAASASAVHPPAAVAGRGIVRSVLADPKAFLAQWMRERGATGGAAAAPVAAQRAPAPNVRAAAAKVKPVVIDLTSEPDSPVAQARPAAVEPVAARTRAGRNKAKATAKE